jgi:hypothetical protein
MLTTLQRLYRLSMTRPFVVAMSFVALIATAASVTPRESKVVALSVSEVRTPPVPDRQISTRGRFPQVSRTGVDVTWANLGLRRALIDDEDRFAAVVRADPPSPLTAPGFYETNPAPSLMSASSVLVSALIPTWKIQPGLNGGIEWVAMTVETRTGRQVRLADLFARPYKGLTALAAVARRRLTRQSRCIRNSVNDAISGKEYASGFAPTFDHYRYFALLTRGIEIGFPEDQVGGPVCGRVSVTVPYQAIARHLSKAGATLIAGVRTPMSVAVHH